MSEANISSTANIFLNCQVNHITGTSVVDGFLSTSLCDNNSFLNCFVQNSNVTDVNGVACGFHIINNNRNRLIGCFALSNTAPASTVAAPLYGSYGFKIDTATGTSLRNCVANDNNGAPTGRGVGFFWLATNSCAATENYADRNTIGFDANNVVFNGVLGNSFVRNIAQKNINSNYSSAWPAGANQVVNANAIMGLTQPWNNVGTN